MLGFRKKNNPITNRINTIKKIVRRVKFPLKYSVYIDDGSSGRFRTSADESWQLLRDSNNLTFLEKRKFCRRNGPSVIQRHADGYPLLNAEGKNAFGKRMYGPDAIYLNGTERYGELPYDPLNQFNIFLPVPGRDPDDMYLRAGTFPPSQKFLNQQYFLYLKHKRKEQSEKKKLKRKQEQSIKTNYRVKLENGVLKVKGKKKKSSNMQSANVDWPW